MKAFANGILKSSKKAFFFKNSTKELIESETKMERRLLEHICMFKALKS